MKDLRDLTTAELTEVTASDAPAPGGGSISAYAGALAASLSGMVAKLSSSGKYAELGEEMQQISDKAEEIRTGLLSAMQADTEAFAVFMDALSMPKSTDEEKAARKAAMQEGLKAAAEVPLKTAQTILPVFDLLESVILKGNSTAVTDALVGVMMARSGILGACFNVRINLQSISDASYVEEKELMVKALAAEAVKREAALLKLSSVSDSLV